VTAKAESALSGITAVRQAQAESDKANAQQINALTAKVGNAESTVSQVSSVVAGLNGKVSSMHTIKTQAIAGGRTAVAGIALASLYAPTGLIGQWLSHLGIQLAYTPSGIEIALIFVSLPFTVRAIQPVLANLDPSYEEAAQILGASRLTTLRKVIIPAVLPALIGGAGMGFARSLGEYGSVIFIAGNVPLVSEIAPLIIMSKLDLYDVQGASVVALLMLAISFLLILFINLAQWSVAKRISPIR